MRWPLLTLSMLALACSTDNPTAPLALASIGDPRQAMIVVLRSGDPGVLAVQVGASPKFIYRRALRGFAADLTPQAAEGLRRNPAVAYVEADGVVHIDGTQLNPDWGLDRIDDRVGLDGSYVYATTGAGVNVYVIDTGIRTTHQDFGGRASWDFSSQKGPDANIDCHGHGTHVAGIVGGATYGVAKGVRLHAVKVLDCAGSGTVSQVIAGIDWVTAHRVLPAVANMSLSGGKSQAENDAVAGSIAAGVSYAVAAGNNNLDACIFSPASAPAALTVGATTTTDTRASFSNFGTCLDLFAPGEGITSDWNTDDVATRTASGTSMASPHVAGAAALYLETHPAASPATVASAITAAATQARVAGVGTGSPNLLLFTGDPATAQPPPDSTTCKGKAWWKRC